MPRSPAYRGDLVRDVPERLLPTRFAQGAAHPLRHGHALRARGALDLADFRLVEKHLKTLTHGHESIRLSQ
jgi:hypothetical protein